LPLTASGKKVLARMKKTYGAKKGERVFHASIKDRKPGSSKWHAKKKATRKKS